MIFKKTMTEFFAEVLRAPLACYRRSWGAVTEKGDAVFLRCWTDRVQRINGKECVMVLSDQWRGGPFGYPERQEHLARIAGGLPCYIVMCDPKSKLDTRHRGVRYCYKDGVYKGGEVFQHDGCLWMVRGLYVPIRELLTYRQWRELVA